MARQIHRLNALQVERLARKGRHADGGGLYLSIGEGGRKRWVFVYRDRRTGQLREQGLGARADVTLAKAREKASAACALLANCKDPIEEAKFVEPHRPTFSAIADDVVASLKKGVAQPEAQGSMADDASSLLQGSPREARRHDHDR